MEAATFNLQSVSAVPGAHLPTVLHWYRVGLWNISSLALFIYFTPQETCPLYIVQLQTLVAS